MNRNTATSYQDYQYLEVPDIFLHFLYAEFKYRLCLPLSNSSLKEHFWTVLKVVLMKDFHSTAKESSHIKLIMGYSLKIPSTPMGSTLFFLKSLHLVKGLMNLGNHIQKLVHFSNLFVDNDGKSCKCTDSLEYSV